MDVYSRGASEFECVAYCCLVMISHGLWRTFYILLIFYISTTLLVECSNRTCFPKRYKQQPEQQPIRLTELDAAFKTMVKLSKVVNYKRGVRARQHFVQGSKSKPKPKEIRIGVFLDADGRESFAQVLPAIDIALQDIQTWPEYNGVTFTTVPIQHINDVACDCLEAVGMLQSKAIDVMFGPLNDFTVANVARFSTAQFNIPVLTPAGYPRQLNDKTEYGLLTRTFFTHDDLDWVFNRTFQKFGWLPDRQTPVAVYSERDESVSENIAGHTQMQNLFQQQSIDLFLKTGSYKAFSSFPREPDDEQRELFLKRLIGNARGQFTYCS